MRPIFAAIQQMHCCQKDSSLSQAGKKSSRPSLHRGLGVTIIRRSALADRGVSHPPHMLRPCQTSRWPLRANSASAMAIDQQKALLFGAAAAVRLLLFAAFPSLPNLLAGRVEVSTPVTSFKRLQEGLFLYTHNVSPYDGGIYHQVLLHLRE